MMVQARYSCSVKISLTIWCENVIFDKDTISLARLYTLSEKP